jgi:hypothetical protein
MIETLAEARDSGIQITARCAWGRREGLKSIRECKAGNAARSRHARLDSRRGVPGLDA